MTRSRPFCDGIRRRDFLRIGAVGAFGFEAALPSILQQQQALAEEVASGSAKDVSVIYLFLLGGLSTIDTFDMKPDAPANIRGEFDLIKTNVPGIEVCEHLPLCAQHADKFSLIRSFNHGNSGHGPADKFMLSGYLQKPMPSFGSVVASEFGRGGGSVPPYVVLPKMHDAAGPDFLGSRAAPFLIAADPSAPAFSVPDLVPPLDIDARRLTDRKGLLGDIDRFQRRVEQSSKAGTFGQFREKAFSMMTSTEAKKAFDIQAEPEKLRREYGIHTLGQSCLMARRMVQAGVRYVMINHNNWDTHENNFGDLKTQLLPQLDQGLSTLLRDLSERGMLERTLVVVSGEFGRTPKINGNAGRDHWGPVFTLTLAGGGIQGGRVVGTSDKWAEQPKDNPKGPRDFAATLYHCLGIDPHKMVRAVDGRPIELLSDYKLIEELL